MGLGPGQLHREVSPHHQPAHCGDLAAPGAPAEFGSAFLHLLLQNCCHTAGLRDRLGLGFLSALPRSDPSGQAQEAAAGHACLWEPSSDLLVTLSLTSVQDGVGVLISEAELGWVSGRGVDRGRVEPICHLSDSQAPRSRCPELLGCRH